MCESLRDVHTILTRHIKQHYLDGAVHELHSFGYACQETYGCVIYHESLKNIVLYIYTRHSCVLRAD